MTKAQKEISDAYRSLFGLSPTTTQNEEESPEDKDRRLTKEIQDSEQRLQGWRGKRTSVLSYTPFHKRLKAVENFLLTQELSPLLKGYQAGYFSKGDRERIRFMSAPEGELRIAFPHEPIFPVFQKAPKNSASILCFVDGPDPSRIYRLEIYEDERDAVSHLENVELEIVREEEVFSDLQRELSDNRIEALMANIPLPSDELQEAVPSETPDEQPSESEKPSRRPDGEDTPTPASTNRSEELVAETPATDGAKTLDHAEQPEKRAGRRTTATMIKRARILWKHFPDSKLPVSFEDKKLEKTFSELDGGEVSLPQSERYKKYDSHLELLAAWVDRPSEEDSAAQEAYFALETLMQTFKKTLQRHPRKSVQGQN